MDTPPPRAHWILLAMTLVVLAALLCIASITEGSLGEGSQNRSASQVPAPASVRHAGPILDATRPGAAGVGAPAGTLVLTFDDGPGRYTTQILDVLERYHVPATFFVVGAHVAGHADTLRRMVRDGDDIGVHTFDHPDLSAAAGWRERLEIDATQLAIASATGYTTDLLRMPYSSTPQALTDAQWRALSRVGRYRVVLADLDTRDWTKPGIAQIVAAATPPRPDTGAVVMLHDGGGDRSQTVAALKQFIPRMLARGYQFRTVSQAVGVNSPWTRATTWQRIRGSALLATVVVADWTVGALDWLFLAVGALSLLRLLALMFFARRHARRSDPTDDFLPPVSVIVPAYNERAGIAACVRSLAGSDYPDFEVLVIDDGSTDGTDAVVAELDLPGVRLIRQRNRGKPAALNTGLAAARHDIVVLVDGDTVFDRTTLRELVRPLADPEVGAVSGNAKVGNRRGLFGRWQHVEYVVGFNLDRRMFDLLGCMPTVPGAIGAFRRAALRSVGGVSADTLAEDTDLTMALCRRGWRIVYAPSAVAWTEAPATLGQMWRQRYRWCYGTLQASWKHRRSIVESGAAGKLGRRGIPYLVLFQVVLPVLAPIVDVAALFSLLSGQRTEVAIAWLAFLGLQLLAACEAFVLDGERLRSLWVLPLQQVVYRQLMYLVVIQSVASAVYGVRLRWHKLRRSGILESAPADQLAS